MRATTLLDLTAAPHRQAKLITQTISNHLHFSAIEAGAEEVKAQRRVKLALLPDNMTLVLVFFVLKPLTREGRWRQYLAVFQQKNTPWGLQCERASADSAIGGQDWRQVDTAHPEAFYRLRQRELMITLPVIPDGIGHIDMNTPKRRLTLCVGLGSDWHLSTLSGNRRHNRADAPLEKHRKNATAHCPGKPLFH